MKPEVRSAYYFWFEIYRVLGEECIIMAEIMMDFRKHRISPTKEMLIKEAIRRVGGK